MRDIGGQFIGLEVNMEKGKSNEPSRIEGRGKAFPQILLMSALLGVTSVFASVVCVWDNATGGYICSGEGTPVEVYGGSGQTLPPVVTNVIGVCTNCTDIPPEELKAKIQQCKALTASAIGTLELAEGNLSETEGMIDDRIEILGTYRSYPFTNTNEMYVQMTNIVESADTEQLQIVKDLSSDIGNPPLAWRSRMYWYGLESTYVLARNEISNLQTIKDTVRQSRINIYNTDMTLRNQLDPLLDEMLLDCKDCAYKTNGLSNGGTGGMGERWCTEEQGDALISLLEELRDYGRRMELYAEHTTNYLALGVQLIRDQYLTTLHGIPQDTNWSRVYFDQQPTAWGYDPTNVMHRLELLVYGLNGVTNMVALSTEDQARLDELDQREEEVTEEHESNVDELQEGMNNQMANFRTDADGVPVQTLGSALVDFFRAVGGLDGHQLESGAEIFPSYPLKIGEQEYYIPQLNADESVDTVNQYQTLSRNVFSVIWYIMAAVVIFMYWRWFAAYAHKFTKWASELAKAVMES